MITAQNPEDVDYTQFGIVDALVIDNTGAFTTREALTRHMKAKGVGKVLLTAPGIFFSLFFPNFFSFSFLLPFSLPPFFSPHFSFQARKSPTLFMALTKENSPMMKKPFSALLLVPPMLLFLF